MGLMGGYRCRWLGWTVHSHHQRKVVYRVNGDRARRSLDRPAGNSRDAGAGG